MFYFRTLGSLELRSSSGDEVTGVLAGQKLVALLAYLTVATPRGLHRRDSVIGLLWPELNQERARAALRHSVYRLRGSLGSDALISRGDEDVGINPGVIECDAVKFEQLLDSGSTAEALSLYNGDLLDGFFVRGAPEYERWLDAERTRLRKRASESAWRHAEELAKGNAREDATSWARRAFAIAPYDEQLLRKVMTLLSACGDKAGALREYEALANRLKAEFETVPASETRRLAADLRGNDFAAPAAGSTTAAIPVAAQLPESPGLPAVADKTVESIFLRRKSLIRATAIAAIGVVLVLGAYRIRAGAADSASDSPTIAVFPFEIRGSHDLDYLKDGMSDLLSIGVDGAAGLHSADPRAVLAAVHKHGDGVIDDKSARQISREVGAGLYIRGSVVEAGGLVTLTASLHDTRGRVRATARSSTADRSKLFDMVDEISRDLLASADERAPDLVGLAARTTSSMPALRSYLEGERELRAGRQAAALDAFRDAVSRDSTFALAWYRLSSAGRWTTEYPLAEEATGKAIRFDRSLPPYARRLLEAATAMRDGEYAKSESLYVASTRSRPGDAEAWFGLGDLHYHYNSIRGRSKGEARKSFERALSLDAGDGESRVHLLELAAWDGRVNEVDSLLAGLPAGSDFAAKWPMVRALITGDRVAETKAVSGLRAGDERAIVMMVIHSTPAFPNNLGGAARVTGLLTDPTVSSARRAYGYEVRAQIELARGKWSAAQSDLTSMGSLEPAAAIEYGAVLSLSPDAPTGPRELHALRAALSSWHAAPTPPSASPVFGIHNGFHSQLRLYLLGLISARQRDTLAALAYADTLAHFPGDTIQSLLAGNLSSSVRARVIRMRGDPNAALAELGQPWIDPRTHRSHYSSILAQVADRYFRAELLQEAGKLHEALEAYGAVADYSLDGLMYLPMSHLRRGDIYLQMGDRASAAAHYEKAAALWRDCDPALVSLRNAAERKVAQIRR